MQNWSKSPKKERHLAAFKTEAAPKSKCLFVICDAERDSQRLHIRQEYRFRIKQYNNKKNKIKKTKQKQVSQFFISKWAHFVLQL